jgi:hypothetical protein
MFFILLLGSLRVSNTNLPLKYEVATLYLSSTLFGEKSKLDRMESNPNLEPEEVARVLSDQLTVQREDRLCV